MTEEMLKLVNEIYLKMKKISVEKFKELIKQIENDELREIIASIYLTILSQQGRQLDEESKQILSFSSNLERMVLNKYRIPVITAEDYLAAVKKQGKYNPKEEALQARKELRKQGFKM